MHRQQSSYQNRFMRDALIDIGGGLAGVVLVFALALGGKNVEDTRNRHEVKQILDVNYNNTLSEEELRKFYEVLGLPFETSPSEIFSSDNCRKFLQKYNSK